MTDASEGPGTSGNQLILREDGNLVLCKGTGLVLRESRTSGNGGKELHVQSDGNVVLLGDDGPAWATGGYGKRRRRCLPGTEGCICDTTIPINELNDHGGQNVASQPPEGRPPLTPGRH